MKSLERGECNQHTNHFLFIYSPSSTSWKSVDEGRSSNRQTRTKRLCFNQSSLLHFSSSFSSNSYNQLHSSNRTREFDSIEIRFDYALWFVWVQFGCILRPIWSTPHSSSCSLTWLVGWLKFGQLRFEFRVGLGSVWWVEL